MDLAIAEARRGEAAGEVPTGALIVAPDGQILSRAFSRPISTNDPTSHAEIIALREAASSVGNYRLIGCTIYCTLEPCVMCAGAMVHARIARLVYGAADPKAGAAGSIYNVVTDPRLNHHVEVVCAVREEECRLLLKGFFEKRRKPE